MKNPTFDEHNTEVFIVFLPWPSSLTEFEMDYKWSPGDFPFRKWPDPISVQHQKDCFADFLFLNYFVMWIPAATFTNLLPPPTLVTKDILSKFLTIRPVLYITFNKSRSGLFLHIWSKSPYAHGLIQESQWNQQN